jgi:hypothetical protein
MPRKDPAVLKKVSVSLPFGIGSAEWETERTERKAAWSLYVELVTRVTIQPLGTERGILREVLTSLHSLFKTTREILKEAGPGVGASRNSVGGIAIAVLNKGLHPFLAKWHPKLQDWEAKIPANLSYNEHQKSWSEEDNFRSELDILRQELEHYAKILATIAGVDYF